MYCSNVKGEVGYEIQKDFTLGGLSDTFQNMGLQSDFGPNHKWNLV